MEADKRKRDIEKKDNEIIFSRAIKAGKRIYYLDVKKSRNDDLFIAITESKKKVIGLEDNAQVTFEKHKIFLYKEDFSKFVDGLNEVLSYIKNEQGEAPQRLPFSDETKHIEIPDSGVSIEYENTDDKDDDQERITVKKSFFGKFKL